jgi:hypothetical protein
MTLFEDHHIKFEFILSEGDFGGGNTLEVLCGRGYLKGMVDITKPGLPDKNKANIKISGLSMTNMEKLTTLGFLPMESQKNLVKIMAGSPEKLSVIFEGEIISAWPNMNSVPNPEMTLEAESGAYPQLIPEEPISVQGEAPIADLIAKECAVIGYTFKNENVSASVRNAVFNGSPIEKMQAMANQVGAELIIDDRTVFLLPGDGTAREGNAVLLSKETGLLKYPEFTNDGINCSCIFNPELQQGGLIKIESLMPHANGTWKIVKIKHSLSSVDKWQTDLESQYVGD